MKFISESIEKAPKHLVGGKGAQLQNLLSLGAKVSDFFILTTNVDLYFREHKAFPPEVKIKMENFFKRHPVIALRSSMTIEDGANASFAGLFETFLNVTSNNWQESLGRIFDSLHSPRVKEYLKLKGIREELFMAVVAQKLIECEKSGVLFTRSPLWPTAAVAIDAAKGMGEGVVSGHSDVDHYKYSRTGECLGQSIKSEKQVLSESEIQGLIQTGLNLEKRIGTPCDIEFGFYKDELYLFQIRPITQKILPLVYLVDTNLSESYPGVVSPFTASFVKNAYKNVFSEAAVLMGASEKKLSELKPHYEKLISSVDDHLYYNLEHYYAALRALPGGEKNIENWHKMIGGKRGSIETPYHNTAPTFVDNLETFKSLLFTLVNRQRILGNFISDLEEKRKKIEIESLNSKSSKELTIFLQDLLTRPLGFGLTVVNDIFIMTGLRILIGFLKRKGFTEEAVIDLLKTHQEIDSLKPLIALNDLSQNLSMEFILEFKKNSASPGLFPYDKTFSTLNHKGFNREVDCVRDFLDQFGDRSFEELKLESLPLKNNPELFHDLLFWAKLHPHSEKKMMNNVSDIPQGFFMRRVLSFTRSSISFREAMRLWRGRFYHLIRLNVLRLRELLIKEDVSWLNYSVLDFFSITSSEWAKLSKGEYSANDIQSRMDERRSWQTKKKNYLELIPWVESEPFPEFQQNNFEGVLSGQGVSQGVREGIALVLDTPQEAFDNPIQDFILVTKNTDPAWVYIMSRSLGLISEKGSLLSHTAIIGRELGVPTIVGVKEATHKIKTGQKLRIDGQKGTIEIL